VRHLIKLHKHLVVVYWFEAVCMSRFIIFHRTKNKPLLEYLEIMGGNIQRLNEIRYLDLLLDSRLRWADHLKFLKSKVLDFKVHKYIEVAFGWNMGY